MARRAKQSETSNAAPRGGAPSRGRTMPYEPAFADLARKFCLLGATDAELALLFEVDGRTIERWIAEIPEFSRAVTEGRSIADAEVGNKLFRRAIGYSHEAVKVFNNRGTPLVIDYTEHYPPDPTSMIFWLKNRRPDLWRDKVEHEHTTTDEMLALLDAGRKRAARGRAS
jgi:hypothetical protein